MAFHGHTGTTIAQLPRAVRFVVRHKGGGGAGTRSSGKVNRGGGSRSGSGSSARAIPPPTGFEWCRRCGLKGDVRFAKPVGSAADAVPCYTLSAGAVCDQARLYREAAKRNAVIGVCAFAAATAVAWYVGELDKKKQRAAADVVQINRSCDGA